MRNKLLFFIILLNCSQNYAQSLKGQLTLQPNQTISLTGFNYYNSYKLANSTIDSAGSFTLNYPKKYSGMALLKTQDNTSVLFILGEKNLTIKGAHLNTPKELHFKNSIENPNFVIAATQTNLNNKSYAAWHYLHKLYKEPYLNTQTKTVGTIEEVLLSHSKRTAAILDNIPKNTYIHWYAPLRALVTTMPSTVRNYPKRIPSAITQFRTIDFTDTRFKTAGLLRPLIEGHYQLLENMGQPLDSVYTQMNISTSFLINNIKNNKELLNTVALKLTSFLEKKSLIAVATHLSKTLLSLQNCNCTLDQKLLDRLRTYNLLKVGSLAPDIQLTPIKKLSTLTTPVLLIFGSSTCPACIKEGVQLLKYYKANGPIRGVTVVYISLDTDKAAFKEAYNKSPWQTYCSFNGWDTKAAKDYFVNATPTYFLLDKDRKIIARPKNIEAANYWLQENR